MHQAGPFNPAFGAESFGLKDLKSISYNKAMKPQAFDTLYADMLAMPRAWSFMRLYGGAWSARTDGSSLYLVH